MGVTDWHGSEWMAATYLLLLDGPFTTCKFDAVTAVLMRTGTDLSVLDPSQRAEWGCHGLARILSVLDGCYLLLLVTDWHGSESAGWLQCWMAATYCY